MAEFFNVINIALIVYSLLLLLRILSTWFRGASLGAPGQILRQITDPYLQIFYRFKFLRSGAMDFTPLAAILVLVVATQLTGRLAAQQEITAGYFLGVALFATWRMAQFLFVVLLAIIIGGRLLVLDFLVPFLLTA